MRLTSILGISSLVVAFSGTARADGASMGAPPPDANAIVEAPKAGAAAPTFAKPNDETTAGVSAGGLFATGNSQLLAASVNGKLDMRRGDDAFGAGLVGNFGESATRPKGIVLSTENVQGRLRYERYVSDRVSFFLIGTGRHDRFQGLDFRLNIDPGVKYLFVNDDATKLWAEAGYDFQYDIRRNASRVVVDSTGTPTGALLDKTLTDHSGRLFAGLRHAFNKDVTVSTGLEFLQSFVDSSRTRINYDALLAANVGSGISLGVGFVARYDFAHLPSVVDLDTSTTLSVIYAFSSATPKTP